MGEMDTKKVGASRGHRRKPAALSSKERYIRKGTKAETMVSQRVDKILGSSKSRFRAPEIVTILQLCRTNNWDFEATGKMLGIKATTIKSWRKDAVLDRIDLFAKAVIDQLVIKIAAADRGNGVVAIPHPKATLATLDKGINSIVDKAILARQLAIDRILEIIPDEKRVDNLLAVIKEMNVIVKGDDDIIGEGGGSILPALQKLTNNSSIDQDEMMVSLMNKLSAQPNFIQINNYQKDNIEDVEPIPPEEEINTEPNGEQN